MKKIILVLGLFIAICIIVIPLLVSHLINRANIFPQSLHISPTSLPSPAVKFSSVTYDDITYEYALFTVQPGSVTTLIPNFSEKKPSSQIIKENQCKAAINGGFYDTSGKPLGLFYSKSYSQNAIQSALVNGFLSIYPTFTISGDVPDTNKIALQSGPLLLLNAKPLPLQIRNDEHARRMVAGITQKGNLVFLSIFIHDSFNQGPELANLPKVLAVINQTRSDKMVSAINLDGGSASIFKNDNIYIQEVATVGSIFCVK